LERREMTMLALIHVEPCMLVQVGLPRRLLGLPVPPSVILFAGLPVRTTKRRVVVPSIHRRDYVDDLIGPVRLVDGRVRGEVAGLAG
jgi:hypothetical protein